jgi:RND superfamily putative drug exporter
MDYDILLTTRIREYRFDKGMSNDEAIHQAVLHSGSVITICGVIMAFTFGTLMLSNTLLLQQIGFALWFAILVDALIVRTYIVPAAMHLMGEWNWKGPAFLHPKRLPTTHEAASAVEHMEVREYDAEGHLKE